ncbi:conserved Plasmodium protein, unknown function [Plasmodium relictum]|uniref:Uncharacterized protein n=1 Tax=Plasmodium relictum TaxID=85471 RepID=A0A1J1HF22_PLARL|nr:conserved Plasmodium protein, unknown function [Plasmodium relictum]CRH02658.1 conserved Plasmodium protein, unknown function [Plasmodium relictum]
MIPIENIKIHSQKITTKNDSNEKNKIEKLEEINYYINSENNNKNSLNSDNINENNKINLNNNNNNNINGNNKINSNDNNNSNENSKFNSSDNNNNNLDNSNNNIDENSDKLNCNNNSINNDNNNSNEDDNKLIKNDKRKIIMFSSILRYKRYLTKKGNTYFDFNQTNLELNEKEMLVQSSNFYHLFDLRSLFFPHIYFNINSHMNINISDYLNYIKNQLNIGINSEQSKNINYSSKQEFILEAIEQVEHIEIKVKIIKKLFLILNKNVAEKIKKYIDKIPEINSNDYIFVQTNRKNDILFGYIKSNKYNLFFEILNFKKIFLQHYKDNIKIDIYDINLINKSDDYFENRNGGIFLKEQNVNVTKDTFDSITFSSKYYFDYYFSKNSVVEYDYSNEKKKMLLVFNLCISYVKNNLFILVIYNDNNYSNNSNVNNNSNFLYYEELDVYNKQFNLNNIDKNIFKTNSFFIDNLYRNLKSKLLCSFTFKYLPLDDYIRSINFSKIKKSKFYKNLYTFIIYCLSNEGIVYIFFCNLLILNIFYENKFELIVKKYFCFQLNRESSYNKISTVNCNSKYLYSLCSHNIFPYKKFYNFINKNIYASNLNDTSRNVERESKIYFDNNSNKIGNNFTNDFLTYEKNDSESIMNNSDLDYKIRNDHLNIDCYVNKKDDSNYVDIAYYKYTFLIITCKYDFSIVTLRRKKKSFQMELINYSFSNSKSSNIICNVIVNKCNFEKYNENKKKSKSFILFEIMCFYQNGLMKKYNYVCTLKNKNFEFFLTENEMKNGIISKKNFFKPLLFPFNEEVLKKKKKFNNIILNNVQLSYFKNFIYIYFQEKQYESISLAINNQCLIINYIKAISKLFKKICTLLYKKKEKESSNNSNVNNEIKENCENYHSVDKRNRFSDKNDELNYNDERISYFLNEIDSNVFCDKNMMNYLNCNLFTQREHKTCFLEYKYIIFGFYDLHLINEKNNGNINEMKTKMNKKILMNSCDIHSHFNFLNIIKSYINYNTLKKCINNLPNENKKVEMNFYYFILILNYFQNNYVYEYNSFFHLAYNELHQKGSFSYKRKIYSKLFFENFELIDITKYSSILLSFLLHMYNFCLKQNGLSNDNFSSHITFFLINKKTKKNKKKFRYFCKINEGKNDIASDNRSKDETNIIKCINDEYMKDNFDNLKNNASKENVKFDDEKKILMNENKKDIINFLTLQKCLYYINKIKKYMNLTLNTETSNYNIQLDIYINIYFCQIFFIILNTLRINNTNIYVNLNYNIKKNNLDYFYLLILINFYSLFYLLIFSKDILNENLENEKKADNKESKINKEFKILKFFNEVYVEQRNKNIEKTESLNIENISITSHNFEKYLALIFENVKEKIDQINVDNYIIQKLFFKINCLLCDKVCISNIYNNYYICENNHIFSKCMITFCCIYKNNLILPTIFNLDDLNKKLFDEFNTSLKFNLLIKVDFIYFCSFCYYFISTKNIFFEKHFFFNQCPFCNHELNIL